MEGNVLSLKGIHSEHEIETYIVQLRYGLRSYQVTIKSKSVYSGLLFALVGTASLSLAASAQEANPTSRQDEQGQGQVQMRDGVAYYKVQVVDRTLPAINYFHRSGSTKIAFIGT